MIISIKIGIDGARSVTNYSHHFLNIDIIDENFVISTFVILDIKTSSKKVVYLNDKPNSDKNTRPLFFSFASESPKLSVQIMDQMIQPSSIEIEYDGQIFDLNFMTTMR